MANKTSAGTKFSPETTKEMFSKVKDHSSLVRLSKQTPLPFSGTDIFTFSLDGEVSIVGEGEQKPAGSATIAPVQMRPLKVLYQHRVSDEFMRCSEEKALNILDAFNDGFAKKIAAGLDIMAFHGVNPATLTASDKIGQNHLDTVKAITYADNPENALNDAVAAMGDYQPTGYALSKTFGAYLGNYKENGVSQYPEFKLGANPGNLGGTVCDVNTTVSKGNDTALAYVGDFATAFKWGYADDVKMEVIQYGDPDGQGDLKRTNEVVIRAEAYIGWAILDPKAFARVVSGE